MTETTNRFVALTQATTEKEQGYASKILALSGILQTTLEINELIALFSKELGQFVSFDGIAYRFPTLSIDIRLGQQESEHSCSYQLLVADQQLGEFKLFRRFPFTEGELEAVENLLSALLYPLRNTLLYQQALNSASIDPLTGVHNRTTMAGTIKRETGLAQRHGNQLSLILLDIDHFKSINDRFGHLYGDQVITAVARCARDTIRESDVIFRYGGEEFLILLTNTGIEGASLLAERIRLSIKKQRFPNLKNASVTVSLGVTALQTGDSCDDLVERADHALYDAKHQGRNRVVAR